MRILDTVIVHIIKGILSRKSIFLYVKGCVLLSSETYFLSASGMINPLIFIILFKILVIVVGEKCLPGPKLDCEIWVPVHNQAVRCAYRSKTWLSNMHTSPILVGEIQLPANSSLNITEIQGNHISPTGFGPVCISDRQVLDW